MQSISVEHCKIHFTTSLECLLLRPPSFQIRYNYCASEEGIISQNDCCDFHEDIDNLYYLCKKWLMNFTILKCHVITITNNKSPVRFCYKMNAVPLERVTELLYLGINVDSTLSWSPHLNKIVNKANRVCGLIKRTLGWHAPQQTKPMLYCALARPILE